MSEQIRKKRLFDLANLVGESPFAQKVFVSGSHTYLAMAAPGTLEAEARWRAWDVDTSVANTTKITFADGNAQFDNVATDLTALDYS